MRPTEDRVGTVAYLADIPDGAGTWPCRSDTIASHLAAKRIELEAQPYLTFAAAATLRTASCGSSFEFMKFVTASVIAPSTADD